MAKDSNSRKLPRILTPIETCCQRRVDRQYTHPFHHRNTTETLVKLIHKSINGLADSRDHHNSFHIPFSLLMVLPKGKVVVEVHRRPDVVSSRVAGRMSRNRSTYDGHALLLSYDYLSREKIASRIASCNVSISISKDPPHFHITGWQRCLHQLLHTRYHHDEHVDGARGLGWLYWLRFVVHIVGSVFLEYSSLSVVLP